MSNRLAITALIIATITIVTSHRLSSFQLTHRKHLLVLYTHPTVQSEQSFQQLNFKIDFASTEISLGKQYAHQPIFLDRGLKHQIGEDVKIHVRSPDKNMKSDLTDEEEQVHGIVGFKNGSDFFRVIKQAAGLEQSKLWFKIYENVIEILKEGCSNPIFTPISVSLQTNEHSQTVTIDQLSLNFIMKTNRFINLIGKESNPFTVTPAQLRNKVNIQILNIVQSVPLKALLKDCRKISGSTNLQCQLQQGQSKPKTDDFGMLLFEFDPIVCTDRAAVEFKDEGKIDSIGYYWSHIMLIVIEIALILVFKHRNGVVRRIKCFIKNRKIK